MGSRAIATYLGLSSADRGITSLPLHYCYGLSVLHAHLVAGGSVVLTGTSVVDPCFAAAVHGHGVTSLAGVPYTFEMLEQSGPERIRAASLRLLTQAGGRMAPDAVARWRDRAAGWGAQLYVMYGQTEATARIAYLPPHLARVADAVGLGAAFAAWWDLLRWPLAAAALVGWAATVLHVAPSHDTPWRHDLPGAVLAGACWAVLTVALRRRAADRPALALPARHRATRRR